MLNQQKVIVVSTGQDARCLVPQLLDRGDQVIVTARYSSLPNNVRFDNFPRINECIIKTMDLTDPLSVSGVIAKYQPTQIYCLGALSHVGESFNQPYNYVMTDGVGPLNVLEAVRQYSKHSKIYNALTSECFGSNIDKDGFQRITTPFQSNSPYAASKLLAYNLSRVYRESYGLFVVCGFLFNHTSIHRTPPENFIESKVCKYVAELQHSIERGESHKKLQIGDLTPCRDWGSAVEYMDAAMRMLDNDEPKDYVVATGKTHSIEDLIENAFSYYGLDWKDWTEQNPAFMRPCDVPILKGDSRPIQNELGWKPKKRFSGLMGELIDHYYANA